jgi:hypothetical protein
MRTLPIRSRQLQVKSEYDVVVMRQEVRQLARDLGLGLSQQAKISTAISAVARALIATGRCTTMRMRTDDQALHPALEISCTLAVQQTPEELAQLEQALHVGEARALVDEAGLSLDGSGALLILRMWLNR